MTKFEGLPKPLARALTDQGYETLTPVQEAVNAPDMGGDLLVSAQTGSGKTVAFGMAMSVDLLGDEDILPKAGRPLALVISPTRELAMQVKSELTWLYKHAKSQLASCVGGMDTRSEVRTLDRGAHIVVGTPGRLVDHIKRRSLDLSQLEVVVMDEADEMLDLGFREDLEFILEHTPEERRTLLFSATVPPAINKLAQTFQKDAKRLELKSKNTQHSDIDYQALVCTPHDREKAMINLMRFHDPRATVIFCGTRAEVTNLSAKLHNRGFSVVSLSGALSQDERSNALQAMRDGRARVCVATDVAARGIDLPGLELVIHADLPQNTEALLHRSGRTGRAGRKGISALIVTLKQQGKAKRLLKWAKVDANWQNPPSADMVRERDKGRMLEMIADDSLMAQVGEEDLVAEIIEKASPQHVAAAFLSLYRTGKSAPEELNEVSVDGGKPKEERPNFEKSVWISLSVGRDESAGPRWLLPMVCEAGGINKKSIGAIRIQQNNTFVELNEDISESFFAMLGDKMTLEDRVGVERVDGKPEFEARPERPPRRNDRGDRGDRRGGGGGGFKGKPRFDDDRGPR
ncbi:MAG: DEAD/DEAH box helicase, partial [Halocynthiibacter sp.]